VYPSLQLFLSQQEVGADQLCGNCLDSILGEESASDSHGFIPLLGKVPLYAVMTDGGVFGHLILHAQQDALHQIERVDDEFRRDRRRVEITREMPTKLKGVVDVTNEREGFVLKNVLGNFDEQNKDFLPIWIVESTSFVEPSCFQEDRVEESH
jgi:hypothetical protein